MSKNKDTAVTKALKQKKGTKPNPNLMNKIPRSRLNEVISQRKTLKVK